MLKQKLAAGHQRPKQILDDGAAFGGGRLGEDGQQPLAFGGAGQSGEGQQIGLVDDGGRFLF